MKKLLLGILLTSLLIAYPVYAAVVEKTNVLTMNAASDAVTGLWNVNAVVWTSDPSNKIYADASMLVSDADGDRIASFESSSIDSNFSLSLSAPIVVNGITATTLDTGVLYIYGTRR